jgi:hypothetical protein
MWRYEERADACFGLSPTTGGRIMRTTAMCIAWMLALGAFVNHAEAEPVVNVGNHQLMPNMPNQSIDIMVSGGDAVQGVTMRVQVGDGGTAPESGIPASGPRITALDLLSDTIFSGNNTGQSNVLGWDQMWVVSTTTSSDQVPAAGLLARVTLDTTGWDAGTFPLHLGETRDGASDFAGIPMRISEGSITIVPEPAAWGLSLGCLATMLGHIRRRRTAAPRGSILNF